MAWGVDLDMSVIEDSNHDAGGLTCVVPPRDAGKGETEKGVDFPVVNLPFSLCR